MLPLNKKKLIASLVLGAITISPGIKAKANFSAAGDWCYNKREVYAYDRDISGEKIGVLKTNEQIYRILCGENCDLVNYKDSYLGFIEKDAIQPISLKESAITYEEINEQGFTKSCVNMRIGCGVDYNKITTIPSGENVDILAVSNNGWYLVDYNNTLGFVNCEYINRVDSLKLNEQISKLPKVYKAVCALVDVNIRESASVDSLKLAVLKQGLKISMIGHENGWYQVQHNGQIGYISDQYVKEIYCIEGSYYKVVSMKNDALGYSAPYGNVIGTIPKYEVAFIYGETDDFYLAESDGRVGFLKKMDCNTLDGKYVIIDISSQTMTLYNDLYPILTSSVVTGKNTTPTHLGLYNISSMEKDRLLVGEDYQSFVKYWMGFNGGEGLHDASWRKTFGGNIYQENGSHGCVNLPVNIAKELYNNVSIKDKVLVKK